MSVHTCGICGGELVITYDAINRPRRRCPKCQGVMPPTEGPTEPHYLHNQRATCRAELEYPLDDAPTSTVVPRPTKPGRAPRTKDCIYCGVAIEQAATGRPRKRCEDVRACANRQGLAARGRRAS